MNDDMTEGSAAEEASESPAEETSEQTEGTEEGSVKVPEAFQKSADGLVYEANKHELEYLRSCIMEREKMLYKAESSSEKKGDFDTEGMPE